MKKSSSVSFNRLGPLGVLLLLTLVVCGVWKRGGAGSGAEILSSEEVKGLGKGGPVAGAASFERLDRVEVESGVSVVTGLEARADGQPWKGIAEWERLGAIGSEGAGG